MKQFQSVLPDIQKAIVTRVLESVSEIIRLEIRRVLRDSLSDLEDAMADPIDEELEVWPESHWPGFALRQADVFHSYMAW